MSTPEKESEKPKSLLLSPPVLRPWHPEWWIPDFGAEQRAECISRIESGATPDASYYVLIVLSTLIASYGLVSNSTATVIGAMIVAPLMGPILGLAMGTVLGDTRMFRRSLVAELSGVVLVIATGILVAHVVGISQIDFTASEIANRTRPTLYDLAIGLAAGLAGAFCLVHPGLQAGVAGVAIAVALVPPLSVTGLTTAGWMAGELPWRPAFGSFMLFLANFLTIELAAGSLFAAMGFRLKQRERGKGEFRRAIAIQFLLLIATGVFLSGQLASLVRERIGLSVSRHVVRSALREIPGADLDNLSVDLRGSKLNVKAVVGSRTELTPKQVAEIEAEVQKALKERLERVQATLVVRTVSSTYASASSFLYEPQDTPPSPEQLRSQLLEQALRSLLTQYSGVELDGFQPLPLNWRGKSSEDSKPSGDEWPVEVTLRSPYSFTPALVTEFQEQLNLALRDAEAFAGKPLRILVRTISVSTATASNTLKIRAPKSAEDREIQELDSLLSQAASFLLSQSLVQVSSRRVDNEILDGKKHYSSSLQFEGETLVSQEQANRLREKVETLFQQSQGQDISVSLDVSSRLARNMKLDGVSWSASQESILIEDLFALAKKARVQIDESSVSVSTRSTGEVKIEAIAYSEKFLSNSTVLAWQKQIKKKHPDIPSVELRLENRLGQVLRLVPSR